MVTLFEYELHPVDPIILGGPVIFPFAQAKDVLKFYADDVDDCITRIVSVN